MITYSTVLPTTAELTREVFLRNILASMGTVQLNRVLAELPATGIKKLLQDGSRRKLEIATDKESAITAIRSEKPEPAGYTLSREYVLNEKAHIISVQTSIKNYVSGAIPSDQSKQKIPKSLYRMIDAGLIAEDSKLPVTPEPLLLDSERLTHISSILEGTEKSTLPLVCIIPSVFGRYPVSPEKVAKKLTGLAHVLVWEGRKAPHRVEAKGLKFNNCRGSVWLVDPDRQSISETVFTAKKDGRFNQLHRAVLAYNATHRIARTPSFGQIHDAILQEQVVRNEAACREAQISQGLTELKHNQLLQHLDEETKRINDEAMEKALQEAEQIVSSYEEDIEELRNDLYEKNLFLQGLEVENQRLRSHLDQGRIPVIYFGQEKEFYLGEIQDLLLSTLEDALEDVPERSRKRDVIIDILNSNNYRHITKDRNEQVKHLLKGYDGMSSKVRHGLEELGFLVEETNKHCKISYHGDNRYMVVFGSTPSDVRSGKNNAATLARMAY